jgi:hypothetical protein
LIPGSSNSKKEEKQKEEQSETELEIINQKEDQTEDELKIKTSLKKQEQKRNESISKDGTSGCPHSFGYLANRPKEESIPQVCFVCPKMVDCMLSPREN